MVRLLGATETTEAGVQLFAGSHDIETKPGVILLGTTSTGEAAGTAKKGLVMGVVTASGKLTNFDPVAVDGTQVADSILATEEIECAAADSNGEAYVHGPFNKDALDWGAANAAQITAAILELEAKGIYVQEIQAV